MVAECGQEPGRLPRRSGHAVTFISATELGVVVPPNRRIPPPTKGPASGKVRQAQMNGLTVDVTVANNGFTDTLSGGYTYLP